jgi:hypothetical protein
MYRESMKALIAVADKRLRKSLDEQFAEDSETKQWNSYQSLNRKAVAIRDELA